MCSWTAWTEADDLNPERIIPEEKAQPLESMLPGSSEKMGSRDSLDRATDWKPLDTEAMAEMLRRCLDTIGVPSDAINRSTEQFLADIRQEDAEALNAWVNAAAMQIDPIAAMIGRSNPDSNAPESNTSVELLGLAKRLDPSGPDYPTIESLPPEMRAALRTWIGRELVRARLYDEALPIFAEVDPAASPDAASLLFYRGACYHALLKAKEALSDLRSLLQHEDDIPVRYARTAKMMVADIKPLKEDSLDEISRLMTDVTRRLDLGRADDATQHREQEVIDKLTKLIDKIEEQQQQQQQQQSNGQGGNPRGGEAKPMEDSRIAGASGEGDADRKTLDDKGGWGNLPPAERQESLQQISRDLPTHYREAIEAYFRKMATDS
ncbi:hypothetical protein [Neorhodopirellula pilleata]